MLQYIHKVIAGAAGSLALAFSFKCFCDVVKLLPPDSIHNVLNGLGTITVVGGLTYVQYLQKRPLTMSSKLSKEDLSVVCFQLKNLIDNSTQLSAAEKIQRKSEIDQIFNDLMKQKN